ncbi:hypothetical protein [Allocoleopsis franciscana]|uniref:Uncharacterized protein n=1 Tax=Allocoleopsis franciscana PCC 7113 TaxID=1173027 RepID=K9WRA3_9CYAN|nr:hypothetical protein [Allocoleopsis franciscana]AFZ22062.1 hypothetical protein Mic7113_6482 [Allocoleopsis franciscana PCC 7113]
MAANRALLSFEQTQEFIKELAQRMSAKDGDQIKIQMGKNPVYEGRVGQEPDMSKLTETRAGVLRAAIDMDTPNIGSKGDPSNLKQVILLEKNDVQVFRFEKGQVEMSLLTEPEPTQGQSMAQVEGVEVVSLESNGSLEPSFLTAFESISPLETLRHEVEVSELPQDGNVRASTAEFVQQKEAQAKFQQEENAKNWQWFQMARMESERGTYSGSTSIEVIQELAVSKAPVPEAIRGERDEAVRRAEQYVIQVATRALESEGREVLPGVKQVEVGGYQITKNEATGDFAIDKPRQSFLRQDTGKIEQSYRPDGVLKVSGSEVTHNRLLVKDLDNFDYIERKQLTVENLAGMRDLVQSYGQKGNVPIEVWPGGKKQDASIEKMQGSAFRSEQMKLQFIESGKHLQVRDLEGNLQMKAYGDRVEKPLTREQCQSFSSRYQALQQMRQEKQQQLAQAQAAKASAGVEIGG